MTDAMSDEVRGVSSNAIQSMEGLMLMEAWIDVAISPCVEYPNEVVVGRALGCP